MNNIQKQLYYHLAIDNIYDSLLIIFKYTNASGQDLDTRINILNSNWPLTERVIGYGSTTSINSNNGLRLITYSGDNFSNDNGSGGINYYESFYINLNNINKILNEPLELSLHGWFYSNVNSGSVTINLIRYISSIKPIYTISNNKLISFSNYNEFNRNIIFNEDYNVNVQLESNVSFMPALKTIKINNYKLTNNIEILY